MQSNMIGTSLPPRRPPCTGSFPSVPLSDLTLISVPPSSPLRDHVFPPEHVGLGASVSSPFFEFILLVSHSLYVGFVLLGAGHPRLGQLSLPLVTSPRSYYPLDAPVTDIVRLEEWMGLPIPTDRTPRFSLSELYT